MDVNPEEDISQADAVMLLDIYNYASAQQIENKPQGIPKHKMQTKDIWNVCERALDCVIEGVNYHKENR